MVNSAFYPYTGRAFLRRGLKLHYLDEGHGDAVVMVHGNPSWSIYFRGLVEGLKDGHRLIVPDHMAAGFPTSLTTAAMTTRWPAGSTIWRPCSIRSA